MKNTDCFFTNSNSEYNEIVIHEGAQRDTKQRALRENLCFFVDNDFSKLTLIGSTFTWSSHYA